MKRLALIFVIFLFLGCGKTLKEKPKYTKLKLINKASYFFNGKPSCYIEDEQEIDYVFSVVNSLKDDYSDRILVSVNYSYVEVLLVDDKSNKKEFFSIIFTKHNGDVIRYEGKHYYYNPGLVNFIKAKLNMSENPILDNANQK